MTRRNDRVRVTLKSVIGKCSGRDALIGWLLRELDNPKCVGEQRERYQKAFNKLTGPSYESVKFTGGPTFASVDKAISEIEAEEPDPFA